MKSRAFGARGIRQYPTHDSSQLNSHLQRQNAALDAAFFELEQLMATRPLRRIVITDDTDAGHGEALIVTGERPVKIQLPPSRPETAFLTVTIVAARATASITVLAYNGLSTKPTPLETGGGGASTPGERATRSWARRAKCSRGAWGFGATKTTASATGGERCDERREATPTCAGAPRGAFARLRVVERAPPHLEHANASERRLRAFPRRSESATRVRSRGIW